MSSELIADEIYYVPVARNLLENKIDKNIEHPPTGKILIATSIWLFGDNPIGWRAFPLIFGSAGIILAAIAAARIFKNTLITILTAVLISTTPLWNSQSRIATLDIMVSTMILLCGILLWEYLKHPSTKKVVYLGTLLGITASIKWVAIFYLFAVILLLMLISAFKTGQELEFKHYMLGTLTFVISYTLPFIVVRNSNLQEIINSQFLMYAIHAATYDKYLDPTSSRPWSWFIPGSNPLPKSMLIFWSWPFVFVFLVINLLKNHKKALEITFLLISFLSLYLPWYLFSRPTYTSYTLPLIPFICIATAFAINKILHKIINNPSLS